jgi:hypothetical protein
MPPKDRVSKFVYDRALSALEEHVVIPSAPNTHYKNRNILERLTYLSIEQRYAESGLEDLATTRPENTSSADTLLYRLKKLDSKQACWFPQTIQYWESFKEEACFVQKASDSCNRPV